MTNRDMFDLLERIKRVGYRGPAAQPRERMTDEQVKESLREAARWIWHKNPHLQELADLAEDIERLEQMHTVVGSNPVGLTPLANSIRKEYEEKLDRFNAVAAREDVKKDLEDLDTLGVYIKRLMAR